MLVGAKASWDDQRRTTTCLSCLKGGSSGSVIQVQPPGEGNPNDASRVGTPGGSARHEYLRRHAKYDERVKRRFGSLTPVVKVIAPEPQTTTAWAKGAVGEEKLGKAMSEGLDSSVHLLFDCSVPKSRSNIDMIAIAESGVWVIDVKRYSGAVRIRDVGGWRRVEKKLYVGTRDASKSVEGLRWQVEVVRKAVSDSQVPVFPVMCMVDADFGWIPRPTQLDGVWILWGKKLRELITDGADVLDSNQVSEYSRRLSEALPPKAA